MKFDPKKWLELAEKDFELAWNRGYEVLSSRDLNRRYPRISYSPGEEHPLFKTIQDLRRAYLLLGFKEVVNPIIVEDVHVKKQFGKEAPAILDRCFYLSTIPRPDIGISADKVRRIEEIIGRRVEEEEIRGIKRVFHDFKRGNISGDDLSFEISRVLKVEDIKAVRILDEVFGEFKKLRPKSTNLTLRSHMTTGWFITLSELVDKLPLPIKLFSIDRCFRREQREDPTRLYSYFSASCVVVDEDVCVDDGKAIAEALLKQFGFRRFKFRPDEKRSKYYIPGTQTEVFVHHPSRGWIEIATFGIYSPTALCHYDIEYPVLNLGLGVERLAMILYNYSDIRELVYPQFYRISLSDLDIVKSIKIRDMPRTSVGLKVAEMLAKTADKYANERSPCEFLVFKGSIYNKNFKVFIFEREENTRLCGPAYANEIVVYRGSVYGIPKNEEWKEFFENGITTGIRYIDSFGYLVGAELERFAAECDEGERVIRIRVVESLSDINLEMQENVKRMIVSRGGKIDVRGPMFVSVRIEICRE